jgi:hypothetical protein
VTVIPITHFIMLFMSVVTPVKDISGFSFDIKFRTITAMVNGNTNELTISIAPTDRNRADG